MHGPYALWVIYLAPHGCSRSLAHPSSSHSLPLAVLRAHSVCIPSPSISLTLDMLFISQDTSFWDEINIPNWVSASQRGLVKGTASGVPSSYSNETVIFWNNNDAQYWYVLRRDDWRKTYRHCSVGPVPIATDLLPHPRWNPVHMSRPVSFSIGTRSPSPLSTWASVQG